MWFDVILIVDLWVCFLILCFYYGSCGWEFFWVSEMFICNYFCNYKFIQDVVFYVVGLFMIFDFNEFMEKNFFIFGVVVIVQVKNVFQVLLE